MKFVKCINSGYHSIHPDRSSDLTNGKVYKVETSSSGVIGVVNDNGRIEAYSETRFEYILSDEEKADSLKEKIDSSFKEYEAAKKELEIVQALIDSKNKVTTGSRWKRTDSNHEYIIAQTGVESYVLINLASGVRWSNSRHDINDVFGGQKDLFIRI